ncbi:MAG: hypothetical protein K6G04_09275 [Lachnospiraceae bacterium]|nr:hypothetical protein [Lachnospiraceae bacterium]
MTEQQQETLLNVLCLGCGLLCYPLVVVWYIGLVLAIAAVGIAFYHDRKYPTNRVTIVGMWLGLVYIGILILIVIFIWGYFHLLHVRL